MRHHFYAVIFPLEPNHCRTDVLLHMVEQHFTFDEATFRGNPHRLEGKFSSGHLERFHHRVRFQKFLAQKVKQTLERTALKVGRFAQDKVFHGVGGHQHPVVAVGVGGQKVISKHLHAHRAGQHNIRFTAEFGLWDGRNAAQGLGVGALKGRANLSVADTGLHRHLEPEFDLNF